MEVVELVKLLVVVLVESVVVVILELDGSVGLVVVKFVVVVDGVLVVVHAPV